MRIGIIGPAGDTKLKVSRLIGLSLDWVMSHPDRTPEYDPEYSIQFLNWCREMKDTCITKYTPDGVYFASFSDPIKSMVGIITGVNYNLLNDHKLKHEYIINIKTLEHRLPNGDENMISPEKLFKQRNKNLSLEYADKQELDDAWMTLNDYIIYFGYFMCRNYLGKDIWTNVERKDAEFFNEFVEMRVYEDVRSVSEYDFIRENGGSVIRLTVNDEEWSNINDGELGAIDVDYELFCETHDSISNLDKEIYTIANKIYTASKQ